MFPKHRIYEISACRKGCCTFIGSLIDEEFCPVCDKPNEATENAVIYYFPFEDRLRSILTSDLKRFLTYSKIRVPPAPGYIEDIYDGVNWKWFEDQKLYTYLKAVITFILGAKSLSVFNFAGTALTCSIIVLNQYGLCPCLS